MFIDTIIEAKDPSNLTVKQCKDWWENKIANNYFTQFDFSFTVPHLYSKLKLNNNSYVLEIGCGYGRQLVPFAYITPHIYGIDISPSAIQLSQKHCPIAILKEFDGTHIPFENDTFDFVTAVFVFQHTSKQNAIELIKETLRVLKPNGYFLFEFLSNHGCAGEGKEHYSDGLKGMYNNGYTQDELRKLCNDLSLAIEWLEEIDCGDVNNIWLCVKK